jgi:uncharacterized phage infection (PIP) family protein YhgE
MAEIQENEELETVELDDDDAGYEVVDEGDSSETKETRTNVREDDELEDYSENVQKRINKLTAARRQAEEEAAAAVQYIQQVQAENERIKKQMNNLNKGYTNEYEGRINAQEVQAKRALSEAYEAGDYDKVAEAQGAIAQIAIEKERLRTQRAKVARDQAQAQARAQQAPQQQVQRQAPQRDAKLEAWMEKNPWFGQNGDKIMTSAARVIHETLVAEEGFDPTTDDYYREIDRRMRKEMPHKFQDSKRVQSVTPASSTARNPKSGRKKQVELTKGQVALAKRLGVPLEKYAEQVARLEDRRD